MIIKAFKILINNDAGYRYLTGIALATALGQIFFGEKIYLLLVAFVAAAVANATAIGGGFLFMPLFIYAYQLAPPLALKLSISTQAFGMTSGALSWGRNYIDKQAFILASISSVLGVWYATYYWVVPAKFIKPLFAFMSLGVFLVLIIEMRIKSAGQQKKANFFVNIKSCLFLVSVFLGGLITGWTAIGVGEVVALYLLFFYRLRLEVAIGTGVAVLAVSSIAGFIFHADLGNIPLEFLIFTVPGVLLGGHFGVKVAKLIESGTHERVDPKIIKRSPLKMIFASVIFINCVVILLIEFVI